jgi:hypothetical protein
LDSATRLTGVENNMVEGDLLTEPRCDLYGGVIGVAELIAQFALLVPLHDLCSAMAVGGVEETGDAECEVKGEDRKDPSM